MHITDIEISDYRYCDRSARHVAHVHLAQDNHVVTLMCHIDLPRGASAPIPTDAIVGEAKRQLARMPEFRSGRQTLTFASQLCAKAPPELA
ncbi:MAG: hypothetical protein AB8B51_12770 [Sedimentitalea sp.]